MFRRRPPFALVLVAALVPVVVVLALSTRTTERGPLRLGGAGPGFACIIARAPATVTVDGTVRARARARVPISVTERVQSARAVVTVTRSAAIADEARLSRPVAVQATAVASRRACAHGASPAAARGIALRHAFHAALPIAHALALAQARRRLRALIGQLTPPTVAQARLLAAGRAQAAATRARARLARQALSEARARAARGS